MPDEYFERKIRVYSGQKKTDGGKMERFVFKPVKSMLGMNKKPKPSPESAERARLIA